MDDMTITSAARMRRLPHLGWGALLAPVMALSLTLWGVHYSTLIVVFLAASIWYLAPAVAADLLPIALINLGVHWIIWAVDLAKGNVTVPSGGGIGGLLTNFQSIAATTQASGNGARFIISEGGVSFTNPNMTSVAVIDATAGLALVLFGLWLVPRTVGVHTGLVKRNSELSHRVAKLTATRIDAVDTAALELRRVERDLHDGAQARLVALGIALRAAEGLVKTNPDAATALLSEARENSAKALAELRDLVRGINPPVLAERGLGDAIAALALDAQVETTVDIHLPGLASRAGGVGRLLRGSGGAGQRRQARPRHQRAHHRDPCPRAPADRGQRQRFRGRRSIARQRAAWRGAATGYIRRHTRG